MRFHDFDQLIDGNELIGAQVQRPVDTGVHNHSAAFDTVVDVHEASRLVAVAPDLDFMIARFLGFNHLSADRRRGFFATSTR